MGVILEFDKRRQSLRLAEQNRRAALDRIRNGSDARPENQGGGCADGRRVLRLVARGTGCRGSPAIAADRARDGGMGLTWL